MVSMKNPYPPVLAGTIFYAEVDKINPFLEIFD